MDLFEVAALFFTMAVLAAVPSASVALVVARSVSLGPRHGVAAGVGIVLGDLLFIAVVLLGLSVVAELLGGFFVVVKYLGAAYLVWLGVQLFRSAGEGIESERPGRPVGSYATSLLAGFLLTLGDVKAIYFYLGLLPQFVDFQALSLPDVAALVAVTVVAVGGVKVAYALLAGRLLAAAGRRTDLGCATRKTAAAALFGAGGYVLLKN